MSAARDLAIDKAREAGIGWVGVRRGNHAGPLALYVRPQAEAGMVSAFMIEVLTLSIGYLLSPLAQDSVRQVSVELSSIFLKVDGSTKRDNY